MNGTVFEGFPTLPWYNRAESVWQLYQTYEAGWFIPNRGFRWNMLFLRPTASASDFQAARIASMVFQTPYFQVSSNTAVNYGDVHGIVAGAPTGALDVATVGDVVTFTREYENGTAEIVTDRGTGTIQPTWTPR